MSLLDKLNSKQRKAAEKIEGPVLILAGAGSGKTRTITYRIAHMIKEKAISPYRILAVTFTNKAASEMRERVEDLVGVDAKRVTLSTFHSFGLRLLRIFGDKLGYSSSFTIYDTDDSKRVIKSILKDFGRDKDFKPNDILGLISKAKERKINPNAFSQHYPVPSSEIIGDIYKKYNSILKNNNAMDFSDILVNTDNLLDIPEILAKTQDKYRYIMVDEYQDTNTIQYSIISKIADKYKNICVVGDENQSIYRFRGADISNILNFEKDYPNATIIKLEENYRSTKNILSAANSVIKNNKSSIDKKLWTNHPSGDKIKLSECESARDEAYKIQKEIIHQKKKGKNYKDMTILYRTNAQSRIFEEGFIKNGIPYKIFGTIAFYQRAEIKDILAYLNVISNTSDTLNLERILNVPKRKIGLKTYEKIITFANDNNLTLFEALGRADEITTLSSSMRKTLYELGETIQDFILASREMSVSSLFDYILGVLNYTQYLKSNYDDFETRIENIDELKNSIVELEKIVESLTLREYLENVSLVSATDNLDTERDFVKLMTIHNSKGLEFPIVFLTGLEDGLFPNSRADYDNDELEEERRLMYVAITRAEEKLHLSWARNRMKYGSFDDSRMPSRFIDEIPEDLIEKYDENGNKFAVPNAKKKTVLKNTITLDDLNNNFDYKRGEKVMHKKFGLGTVKSVSKKAIRVNFVDGERDIATVVASKFLIKEGK